MTKYSTNRSDFSTASHKQEACVRSGTQGRYTTATSELLFLYFLWKCFGWRPLSSGEHISGRYLPHSRAVLNSLELQKLARSAPRRPHTSSSSTLVPVSKQVWCVVQRVRIWVNHGPNEINLLLSVRPSLAETLSRVNSPVFPIHSLSVLPKV